MAIFGRDADEARLDGLAERARGGRGALALVVGEAGIGKTTLCEQAASEAAQHGMTTVWVGCTQPEPALGPWRQALAQLDVEHSWPRADRAEQFEAVVAALRAHAAERPLHLTFDDVQAADATSLRLLEYIAAQLRSMPALIVATCRAEDVSTTLARLRPYAETVPLAGLDHQALAELTGGAPSDVTALHRLTGGNPLFATELVRMLASEQKPLSVLNSPDPPPLPASVRGLLAQRLDELSEPSGEVTRAAAAVGDRQTIGLLQAVLDLPRPQLLDALQEALAAGVLREDGSGQYVFSHPLLRATVYSSMHLMQRMEVHKRIAQALGAKPPADVLAYHLLAAAPLGLAAEAYQAAMTAAHDAMQMLAYEKAVTHFEQARTALSLDDTAGDRTPVLLGLGQAQAACGQVDAARTAYLQAAELARAAGDNDQLAEAALGLAAGHGFEVTLFDRTQVELLEEALSKTDDARAPVTAAMLRARLSVALSLSGQAERRAQLSEEAVEIARGCDEPGVLAYALAAHCDAIAGPDDTERRLAEAEEVISLAVSQADRHTELLGRRLRVVALLELGDLTAAEVEAARFGDAAALLRQPVYDWYPPLWQAMRALYRRRWPDCERGIAEVRRIGKASENAQLLALIQEGFLCLETGRGERTVALFEQASAGIAQLGMQIQVTLAWVHARVGDLAEATARRAEWAPHALDEAPKDSEYLPLLAQVAELGDMIGDVDLAAWARERLRPYADRYVIEGIGAVCRGPVRRFLEPHPAAVPAANVFRREGDVWLLGYAGRVARLRHAKGLADLAQLLARPDREIPALDLASPAAPEGDRTADDLHVEGDLGEVIDAHARAAYRRRLTELAEADDERSLAERDALLAQLAGAYGLAGRPRRTGDPAERARTAVTARIRATIGRIEAVHPDLGRHLRRSVRTGTLCVYQPDEPISWQL